MLLFWGFPATRLFPLGPKGAAVERPLCPDGDFATDSRQKEADPISRPPLARPPILRRRCSIRRVAGCMEPSSPRAFSASIEWKRGSGFFDLTRFLDANRFPLRLKTHLATRLFATSALRPQQPDVPRSQLLTLTVQKRLQGAPV